MLDWEYTITKAENGFCVRWLEEMENGNVRQLYRLFEAEEFDEWGDHAALVRCLIFLTESFGLSGSKHDARRIITNSREINRLRERAEKAEAELEDNHQTYCSMSEKIADRDEELEKLKAELAEAREALRIQTEFIFRGMKNNPEEIKSTERPHRLP